MATVNLTIALFIESDPTSGGGHQQAMTTLRLLRELAADCRFVVVSPHPGTADRLNRAGIPCRFLRLRKALVWLTFLLRHPLLLKMAPSFCARFLPNRLEQALLELDIDLVLFLEPTWYPLLLERLNFVTTVWDLCHLDYPLPHRILRS